MPEPTLKPILTGSDESKVKPLKPFPTPEQWMLNTGLYAKFQITGREEALWNLEYFCRKLDAYCVHCKKDSVFDRVNINWEYSTKPGCRSIALNHYAAHKSTWHSCEPRLFSLLMQCGRNEKHNMCFYFQVDSDEHVRKIGQYPAIIDLSHHELRRYEKLLGDEKHGELVTAVGLVSHGVGIGAFVYLRRIFEDLIEQAKDEASRSGNWNDPDFERKRMVEKIESLKHYVPSFLVDNKSVYGILSMGVHELAEQECLEFFNVVKLSILIMLDQKIEKEERKRREEDIKKAIRDISSKIAK